MFALALLSLPYMIIGSRAHGGGKPDIPWGLDAWLLPLPYLIFTPQLGWWIIPAYLFGVLGIRLGHGRGFHYNEPFEIGSKKEKVEYLIPSSLPVYWKKFLIMLLTGLGVSICVGLSLSLTGHVASGVLLGLSGMGKALAYFHPKTEVSEYLRGAFLGLGVFIAYLLI